MANRQARDQSQSIYRLPYTQLDSTHISPKPAINDKLYVQNLRLSQTINQLNERIQELTEEKQQYDEKVQRLEAQLIIVREHALGIQQEYRRLKFTHGKVRKQNQQYEKQIKLLNRELRELTEKGNKVPDEYGKSSPVVQKIRNIYDNQSDFIQKSRTSSAIRSKRSPTEYSAKPVMQLPPTKKQPQISQAFRNMVQSARLRLKASRIASEQIINVDELKQFFAQRIVAQGELRYFFQAFPFEIRDKKLVTQAIQICTRECRKNGKLMSGQTLKSFVVNLFGHYQVLSELEEVRMLTYLHEKIYDIGKDIIEQLRIRASGNDFIQYKFFRDIFLKNGLSQVEVEFLVEKIILQSIDLQHLNYFQIQQVLDLYKEPSY